MIYEISQLLSVYRHTTVSMLLMITALMMLMLAYASSRCVREGFIAESECAPYVSRKPPWPLAGPLWWLDWFYDNVTSFFYAGFMVLKYFLDGII